MARMTHALPFVIAMLVTAPRAWAKTEAPGPELAAQQGGFALLRSMSTDFDGDGTDETVGACQKAQRIYLCVFSIEEEGARLQAPLLVTGGPRLEGMGVLDLHRGRPGSEVWITVSEETPDDVAKRTRIYSGVGGTREVFTTVSFQAKPGKAQEEWRASDVVAFGDASPGWSARDDDDDGVFELYVRRKPQLLKVARGGAGPAKFLTGVREGVYRWVDSAGGGAFVEADTERFRDFLPAYEVAQVKASSAWVPPAVLAQWKAEAAERALLAAAQGADGQSPETTEGGGVASSEAGPDLSAFFAHAADQDLQSAWIEDDKKGPGIGEWVEVELGEAAPIHMVRWVGGCTASEAAYRQHNVPERIELRLDGGAPSIVDLQTPERPAPPALAILQAPLQGRPWAKQALVFFDGKTRARSVRLRLLDVVRRGKSNQTCISEISVH